MTHHEIIPPSPAGADTAPPNLRDITPSRRADGWTGQRQRAFLEALSQGSSVTHACKLVGLSQQSAYAFRHAARGASFALGWQAAQLLCAETLADTLMDRALNGTRAVHVDRDGSETHYQRHDNHFAYKMLARADRLVNKANCETSHAAARLIAGEFEQFLDMIERDGGPARAGLFLGARLGAEGMPAGEDDLAPVRTLARADHWLRTHTDLAEPLRTADLDPARRQDWTAEQWLRAEAAGLFELAPRPAAAELGAAEPADVETPENTQLHQHSQPVFEDPPVWWDEQCDEWRTRFPPPAGFDGSEDGEYGDCDYARELAPAEQAVLDAERAADLAEQRAAETIARDAYFAIDPPALPEPSSRSARSAPTRRTPRPVSGSIDMSILGRIKDAILGHGGGIFGKDSPAPAPTPAPAQAGTPVAPTPQNQQSTAPVASAEPVDVEKVLTEKLAAKGNPDLNWRTSIVDLMKLLDLDSSLDNRKELATELGYSGAKDGSAEMNLWLHNAVMLELVNNGAKVPEKLAD